MTHLRGRSMGPFAWSPAKWLGLTSVFVVAVVAQRIFYGYVRSKGVNITGDEPSYLMQAQALSHLTPHILSTVQHDLKAKVFASTYRPGTTINNVEHFDGPHGIVSSFDVGLGALLAPFVAALGAVRGGVVGIICLNTAGLMWLHQRVSRLARVDLVGQILLALIFASPAVLLAVNQIYPDLPSGILVAIGLVEIGMAETEGRLTGLGAAAVALSAGLVPWLQPKNLAPAAVVVLAFAFVAVRSAAKVMAVVVVGIVAASCAALFAYNDFFFGHWLGLPEPPIRLTRLGVEYTLGLLFDRDVGLFVQVPICLVGLVGLVVFGWRKLPGAVVASFLAFGSILLLNGSYTSNPYGGLSLAGRFMWTLIAISLPWTALVVARGAERAIAYAAGLAVVVAVSVWQAFPIFTGQHEYYNPMAALYQPWPTWWHGLGHVLPQFGRSLHYLGTPGWALPLEVVAEATVVTALMRWLARPPRRTVKAHRHGGT